jgi:hypothetical protein
VVVTCNTRLLRYDLRSTISRVLWLIALGVRPAPGRLLPCPVILIELDKIQL